MQVITIGKRLVSSEQIALVEIFDPSSNPEFKPEKEFKGRVILLDRDIVLTEQTPQEFAAEHIFLLFEEDNVAINRSIRFKVETFEATQDFNPSKPFKTRLKWRDPSGKEQSKLLLTSADTVMAAILGNEGEGAIKRPAKRPARGRSGSRRMEAFRS